MKLDRDISRMFKNSIFHVRIYNRITRVIFAADAEHNADFRKNLKHEKEARLSSISILVSGSLLRIALFCAIELDYRGQFDSSDNSVFRITMRN